MLVPSELLNCDKFSGVVCPGYVNPVPLEAAKPLTPSKSGSIIPPSVLAKTSFLIVPKAVFPVSNEDERLASYPNSPKEAVVTVGVIAKDVVTLVE